MKWTHNGLAEDLADHLRGMSRPMMVWLDMQLGPSGSMRPDVFAMAPTYGQIDTRAFERKVNRSDFLADVTAGKALSYMQVAGALSFAAPKGLIRRDEIPEGCGLIERGDDKWRWVRRPTIQRIQSLPTKVWMKLVIDGIARAHDPRGSLRQRLSSDWERQSATNKVLGNELGAILADRNRAIQRLKFEKEQAEEDARKVRDHRLAFQKEQLAKINKDIEEAQETIAGFARDLGLDGGRFWDARSLRRALERMRPDHDAEALRHSAREVDDLRVRVEFMAKELVALSARLSDRAGGEELERAA